MSEELQEFKNFRNSRPFPQDGRAIEPAWFAARGFTDCQDDCWHWQQGAEAVLACRRFDGSWWLQRSITQEEKPKIVRHGALVTWEEEMAAVFGGLLARLPAATAPAAAGQEKPTPQGMLF